MIQLLENSVAIGIFISISLQVWDCGHKMTTVNDLSELKSIGCYRIDFDWIRSNTLLFPNMTEIQSNTPHIFCLKEIKSKNGQIIQW